MAHFPLLHKSLLISTLHPLLSHVKCNTRIPNNYVGNITLQIKYTVVCSLLLVNSFKIRGGRARQLIPLMGRREPDKWNDLTVNWHEVEVFFLRVSSGEVANCSSRSSVFLSLLPSHSCLFLLPSLPLPLPSSFKNSHLIDWQCICKLCNVVNVHGQR